MIITLQILGTAIHLKKILSESNNIYYQYEYFENKLLAKLKFLLKKILLELKNFTDIEKLSF